jgi:hypothetical protein
MEGERVNDHPIIGGRGKEGGDEGGEGVSKENRRGREEEGQKEGVKP